MIYRAALCVGVVALVIALVPSLGSEHTAIAPTPAASIEIGRVHERFQPNTGKIFVLVIGSDARYGNKNTNADAIHIAGINTKTMHGGILNFPRDSWVTIPGHGSAKINTALQKGGPKLLARTLESLTGIRLDYWVLVGFQGFQRIIHDLGGVIVSLPRALYDPGGSGADLKAGRHRLGGGAALSYVRTRKALKHGDISRTTNQARFLLAMLKELRRDINTRPTALLRWMQVARRYTRLDISARETFRLAVLTSQIQPKKIDNVTVPATLGWVGAASVVFIEPSAHKLYKRFKKHASF
jgi:polyisoprenyl-teichoic acid--peptidoglycan teichoic acid transferase